MESFGVKRYRTLEKFRWMVWTRFVTALFVFLIYFFVKKMNVFNFPFVPFAFCCFLEGVINQPYPFVTNRIKKLDYLTYANLVLDLILVSAIIHFLGGIEFAFFSIAYPIIIVLAGIMLSSRACYIVATFSGFAYAALVALEYNRLLPHIPLFGLKLDSLHQFGIVAANILFFYFVAFLSGYSTDLIEEREKKLEEEKRFSESVIANMVDGLVVLDEGGRIKELNAAVEKMSGYSREKLIGVDVIGKLFTREAGARFRNALKDMADHKDIRDLEVTLATASGGGIPLSINASILRIPEEKRVNIIATLRDISREKTMEKMKIEFISTVTHELLTPLTSINGFVTMILEGKAGAVDEKQKHFLEIVRKQTKYLKSMIESMLDFSRIETGRLELNPELLTVGEVAAEMVADMEPQIREKELVIEIDCKDAGCKVLADRVRLGRVFSNIFGNAIKFTPRGRKIKVGVAEEKGFVSVSVIDEGIGISKEYLEKIFEKFFQIDSALTRVVGGAGMGLAIAKEIIEKHGGRIWAESEGVGKGAKLTFNLPRA